MSIAPFITSSRLRASRRVREIYEERPYPVTHRGAIKAAPWLLPPMEWIAAVWDGSARALSPGRIMIAGCGTGSEAFALRRRFHDAHITAFDFSPRSIKIARDLQREFSKMRRIRFLVADLSRGDLGKQVGRDFDFVSCHGVLSYIPQAGEALRNLAGCLALDGALYLGVNGSRHLSANLREVLPTLGVKTGRFEESPELRRVLQLCDLIGGDKLSMRFAKMAPVLLAGDLFGPVIHNLKLSRWLRLAAASGLHFQSSFHAQHGMRHAWQHRSSPLLLPKSRGAVCEIAEKLSPAGFHRILFTRLPLVNPPWSEPAALLTTYPLRTRLYKFQLPRKTARSSLGLQKVGMTSRPFGTQLEWQMPIWEIEILRKSNGRQSLSEILLGMPVPPELLRDQLYRLYQLNVINLLPEPVATK